MGTSNCSKVLWIFLVLTVLSGCAQDKVQDIKEIGDLNDFAAMVEDIEISMYKDIVSEYNQLSLDEMGQLLENSSQEEQKYFYFGRTTCLYCRKFVIENAEFIEKMPNFYYIDTETLSDSEKVALQNYKINVIPAILVGSTLEDVKQIDTDVFVEQREK